MQYMCLIYDEESTWANMPEDERNAVGQYEVVAHDRLADRGVLPGDHDQVNGGGAQEDAVARHHAVVHPVHRLVVRGQRQRDAEDRRRGGRGLARGRADGGK